MRRPRRQVRRRNSARIAVRKFALSAQHLRRGLIEDSYSQAIHSAVRRRGLTLRDHLSGTDANDLMVFSTGQMALQYLMLWLVRVDERHVGVNEV